jgi:hypothetical protein
LNLVINEIDGKWRFFFYFLFYQVHTNSLSINSNTDTIRSDLYCGYKVSFEQPQKLLSNSITKQMLGKWPPPILFIGELGWDLVRFEINFEKSKWFFLFRIKILLSSGKNQHRRFGDSLERRESIPRMPSLRPPILFFHQHDPYCQIPYAKLRDCTQVLRLPNAFRS